MQASLGIAGSAPVIHLDPASAPPRPDLTFLRHRSRSIATPKSPAGALDPRLAAFLAANGSYRPGRRHPGEPAARPAPPPTGVRIVHPTPPTTSLDLDGLPPTQPAAQVPAPKPITLPPPITTPPATPTRLTPAPSPSLDLDLAPPTRLTPPDISAGTASPSLDLDAPPTRPTSPDISAGTASTASTSLDLDAPPTRPTPPDISAGTASTATTSLDLDAPAPAPGVAATPAARRTGPVPTVAAAYLPDIVGARERRILTAHRPSVTLNRRQSAVGTLIFEAACPPSLGDLRLGCLYQLSSGWSSTVSRSDGHREGPARSPRPVVIAHREQFEQLSADLRQAAALRRLVVYLYSATGAALSFAGTFQVTTFGGASVEVPLELNAAAPILAVMSLYNIDGQFVLRAEMEPITASVRDIGRAYGYDQITWIDDRTPTE